MCQNLLCENFAVLAGHGIRQGYHCERSRELKHDAEESVQLELAEFIMRYGARPDADLHELWRRIVFSIAVSNTDDHLRNHGFLLAKSGWELSPAYDINPNPQGHGLSLNITDTENSLDFEFAMEVAPFFRISATEAKKILNKVGSTVGKWRRYGNRPAWYILKTG